MVGSVFFLTFTAMACNRAPTIEDEAGAEASNQNQAIPFPKSTAFQFEHKLPSVIADDRPKVTFSVPVVNRTDAEVTFEQVLRSCSCTDAELKTSKLAPGGHTELLVTINLAGRSGLQRLSVSLVQSTGQTWGFLIELKVYPRAHFSPNPFGYRQLIQDRILPKS